MKARTLLLAAGFVLAAAPAFASECPKHMQAIDEAMAANPQITEEQKAQVEELRAEGERLHEAGDHEASMEALTEAEEILGIEG